MKKILKISAIIILLAIISLPIEHYYCDNIYGWFAFSKSPVVQIDKKTYRCSKDNPEEFIKYMEKNGWNLVEQLGNAYFLKKDEEVVTCLKRIKKLYSEWKIQIDQY